MGPDVSTNYSISYRNIKYPRVELRTGKPLLVLPYGYNPDTFYKKHKNWIFKKIKFIEECLDNAKNKELSKRSGEEFEELVYDIMEKISDELGVKIKKIYFKKMRSKWASLSRLGNLTINKLIKYLPEYLIEYIIFHELVHIIEKNHTNRFWRIISGRYNDYMKLEKELFEYWFKVSENMERHRNFKI
ncbi:MAG: M48 family metallopeptidase [Actinomycetota bacterium]